LLNEAGHVFQGQDCEVADDLEALELAMPLSQERPIEIWQAYGAWRSFEKAVMHCRWTSPSSPLKCVPRADKKISHDCSTPHLLKRN
jgi:hypothetical protein